jgi:hypothetical protein
MRKSPSARVVDWTRSIDADGERETTESRVVREWPDAVHDVRGNPDQVPLPDLSFLVGNFDDAAPGNDVIKLMCGMGMRIDETTAGDLPFTDELQKATTGRILSARRAE